MPLHLIKLCVGVAKVDTLERRVGKGDWLTVHTRQTPRRAAEIEDGGSLFWVFKGMVLARMPVADITTLADGGRSRCEILLEPRVIRVAPLPRRAFQGWRYLEAKDAPSDLSTAELEGLPADLAKQLRALGAW